MWKVYSKSKQWEDDNLIEEVSLASYEDRIEDEEEANNNKTFGRNNKSGSATSQTGDAEEGLERDEVEEVKKLVETESKAVKHLRTVVVIALLLVGGAVTTLTYYFLSNNEEQDFENAFDLYASTVIESANTSAAAIRRNCDDFADTVIALTLAMKAEWPFVTFPEFERLAANLLDQTSGLAVMSIPNLSSDQLENWTAYTLANDFWMPEETIGFSPVLAGIDPETRQPIYNSSGPPRYWPIWQLHPFNPMVPPVNYNLGWDPNGVRDISAVLQLRGAVIGEILEDNDLVTLFPNGNNDQIGNIDPIDPHSAYFQPIFDSFEDSTSSIVGQLCVILRWGRFFENLLPNEIQGINVVLENTCNTKVTWELVGKKAIYIGRDDFHDRSFDGYKISTPFNTYSNTQEAQAVGACLFTVNLYPTQDFKENYTSQDPIWLTVVVGAIFVAIIITFLAYDTFQRRRNTKVVVNAAKSNALVTSLFPSNIRDRLLEPVLDAHLSQPMKSSNTFLTSNNKGQLKNFLDGDGDIVLEQSVRPPIADLFLETTIMFADITGFTAWSSVREPSQVFTLLETIFSSLDKMAKRRKIFKVETVGDCYVAVAGLPEPRNDHAIVMARFARETLSKVQQLVKRLELSLGPGTGELGVRIGLHSGNVTAGVLRGDRARFQLFGDTVNTTARIESMGVKNRIHVSKDTADLLNQAGKGHWLKPRKDMITPKGKSPMQTYFLEAHNLKKSGSTTGSESGDVSEDNGEDAMWGDAEVAATKFERLIDWQVDVFTQLLKQVVARRSALGVVHQCDVGVDNSVSNLGSGKTCLDEVKEIITLPEFDAKAASDQEDPETVVLSNEVTEQLRAYISEIAGMYRSNGFHNWEHACHVTMSVTKLLSRIVRPDLAVEEHGGDGEKIASTLHDHTYGITSDPLTQLSLVFSAMIHDVDHTGVPNTTLVKENSKLADLYKNKSVAEQNSVDLAWKLLEEGPFTDLRHCIYRCNGSDEYRRFRQLVVQAVLATDIADKELKVLRNTRWDNAFSEFRQEEAVRDTVNRKATIVIEHLIQASDVAHTMQHWHIYRKWNENFFKECFRAYQDGRAEKDPTTYWYKGEIGFFDFYIIPLAKKLKKCGVFGVSSDEYLNYALKNRQEWQDRGQEVVEEMKNAVLLPLQNGVTLASVSEAGTTETFHNE